MGDVSLPKFTLVRYVVQVQMALPTLASTAETISVSTLKLCNCARWTNAFCFLEVTPQALLLVVRKRHRASMSGASTFTLWMKFPKSILIAVTLGDFEDSD